MDHFWAYALLIWSLLTWILWTLAMFTDTRLGRGLRKGPSITKRRSDITVFHPTWATLTLLVGIRTLIRENDGPEIVTDTLTGLSLFIILLALVVYWLPIRLPNWTDPSWHEHRRATRRMRKKSTAGRAPSCACALGSPVEHAQDAAGLTGPVTKLEDTSPDACDL